jgi:hypothetical protein
MKNLKRYWFTFQKFSRPTPLNAGCGVTAFNRDDAITILREYVFKKEKNLEWISLIEGIDISTLDQRHVLPNIGDVAKRGIWFPLGYDR